MAQTLAQQQLSNTETGAGKPWGMPLGSTVAKDGITYRLMTASGALVAGNAVVLAPTSANPYLVATTTTAGNSLRYGIVAVSADSGADVLVAIEGIINNAVSTGAIAVGNRVTTSTVAGRVQAVAGTGSGGANGTYTATLTPTILATLTVTQQLFAATLFKDSGGNSPASDFIITGINMQTSNPAGVAIGGGRIITATPSSIGIDFINASTTSVTPTASNIYTIAGAGGGVGAYGGLGTALTSTTGASEAVRVLIHF